VFNVRAKLPVAGFTWRASASSRLSVVRKAANDCSTAGLSVQLGRKLSMVQIEGCTAVVTGGQRGLGLAMVDALLAYGAKKVYATSRSPLPSKDPRVERVQMDVTDYLSVSRVAATATDASIVINNAGTLGGKSLLLSDFEEIRSVFEVNYFGALRVAREFAPVLMRNDGGALVDVHSVLSWVPGSAAYGDSKAALWSATNSLRVALAKQNTLVVGVHMGYTDTDMVRQVVAPKNDPRAVADMC
jgi:NAD(P)-dependent dehydrogenase (short-subunit alcohol dehydrogenase family)